MPALTAFHEVRFPTAISFGASGGPERRTDIVSLASGYEERNSRWANSRRKYNAGFGVRSIDDLHTVVAFFEERRGRLYGFRWLDRVDFQSCAPGAAPAATDQAIGTGNGAKTTFQLVKAYGSAYAPWSRTIAKPVAGSVSVAVNGTPIGSGWSVDTTTGAVTFDTAPDADAAITAGFQFDVPVRFDNETLEVNLTSFAAGSVPSIPLLEIRL